MDLRPHSNVRWEAFRTISGGPYVSRKWGLRYNLDGTLAPDATCDYVRQEAKHNGKSYWARVAPGYYLWWDLSGAWHISTVLGVDGVAYWERINPNPAGLYDPMGTATGAATLALGSHL